ncbi:MAG: type IV toxin-antitoxin system AbiEi family antitoxin domain-containing protein [Candidatus Sumerlaeia bacterium]|nr:type IV toxin-antitoxin system AbiEi family antitoxin domain-containing protein [Candidatus Sumerlaeia bacterium]
MNSNTTITKLFEKRGGMLRTAEALRLGVHPRDLYRLRDEGTIEAVSRGLYRLRSKPLSEHADLVTVTLRCPNAVICLGSALAFHELTTQIPHEVSIAFPRGAWSPRIEHPPIRVHWFSAELLREGVEVHRLDDQEVRITSREKTLVDLFRFRSKLGSDLFVEGLRRYAEGRKRRIPELIRLAKLAGVEGPIRPYLEGVLS